MDVSVIVVSWNAKAYLEECLQSLIEPPPSRSMEIIVVDNASIDGSPEMVEARFPQVKLIRSGENLGFARANNLAIRESSGKYISLVNSDAKVLPGCLDRLADYLDENPRAGNVGPRVLNPDLTMQSTCRRFPGIWNNFCTATGLATAFRSNRFFSGEHMFFFPHDRVMEVDVLVGCFWMLRREVVNQVGLLDESFFMYGEDVDWCRRCWNGGWKVVFVPTGLAIHHRGGSSASQPVRLAVTQQASIIHYWQKHHGPIDLFAIQSIFFFHYGFRYLFGLASRLLRMSKSVQSDLRMSVSSACLKALLSRSPSR
jgi:GT2 family glycosyltransferase